MTVIDTRGALATRSRIATSVLSAGTFLPTTADVLAWVRASAAEVYTDTTIVALEDVEGWRAGIGAPALRHHTGAFFSIEGIEVTASTDPATGHGSTASTVRRWTQPIINQPEVAIIGVEDDKFGQRLKAFVVLEEGASLSEEHLTAHVKTNLASYKTPREVEFLDELPRNATGKVLKRELHDREASSRDAG